MEGVLWEQKRPHRCRVANQARVLMRQQALAVAVQRCMSLQQAETMNAGAVVTATVKEQGSRAHTSRQCVVSEQLCEPQRKPV